MKNEKAVIRFAREVPGKVAGYELHDLIEMSRDGRALTVTYFLPATKKERRLLAKMLPRARRKYRIERTTEPAK